MPNERASSTASLRRISLLAMVCGVLWIGVAFWFKPASSVFTPGGIFALILPLLFIGLASQLARSLVSLRAEAAGLRQDLEVLRQTQGQDPAPAPTPSLDQPVPKRTVAPPPEPENTAPSERSTNTPQGHLELEPHRSEAMPLSIEELISALQFPETPEDRMGFRALRRAMQDHRASLVIQAAQDVLTLLSQDGIYTDDLQPDRARPDLWRRFAQGERGGQITEVGGIRDPDVLEVCAMRLRENAVYRDAVHHFVRRFDMQLRDLEAELTDEELARLTDTRSARAFMLLGRAMGVFG